MTTTALRCVASCNSWLKPVTMSLTISWRSTLLINLLHQPAAVTHTTVREAQTIDPTNTQAPYKQRRYSLHYRLATTHSARNIRDAWISLPISTAAEASLAWVACSLDRKTRLVGRKKLIGREFRLLAAPRPGTAAGRPCIKSIVVSSTAIMLQSILADKYLQATAAHAQPDGEREASVSTEAINQSSNSPAAL